MHWHPLICDQCFLVASDSSNSSRVAQIKEKARGAMGGSGQAGNMDNTSSGQGNVGQGFGNQGNLGQGFDTNQGNLGQGFDNTGAFLACVCSSVLPCSTERFAVSAVTRLYTRSDHCTRPACCHPETPPTGHSAPFRA